MLDFDCFEVLLDLVVSLLVGFVAETSKVDRRGFVLV